MDKPSTLPMTAKDKAPAPRQTDRELALLGKINKQLLELTAEERGRIVDWLFSRHHIAS